MGLDERFLDSEDEGSDFGDGAGFGDVGVPDEAEMPAMSPSRLSRHHTNRAPTRPTPRSFGAFMTSNKAVHTQDVIPDTAPAGPSASNWTQISSAPPPAQKPQLKDHSSLSSMTDPLPTSRKSKRAHETSQTDVIDLTETPRKDVANSGSDVWDVPTSARSQRSTRTYGKRKLAQLSLEQELTPNAMPDTQDPYAFPDATPPTKKKVGCDQPRSPTQRPPDSSPVMLVPIEDATSSDRRTRSTRKKKGGFEVESSMPDTAAPSLYITQSTLTASQKREYRTVSLSSEAMPEGSEMLPPDQTFGAGEVYKSSGATTIAYPTPSRVASSRRLPEITEEMDGNGADTSLAVDADHQPPTKRKRRPAKADAPSTKPQAEPIVIDDEPEQDTPHHHHQPLSETSPNSQPSRAPADSVPLCVTGVDEGKENGGLEVVAVAAKDDALVRKTEGKGTEREMEKGTEREMEKGTEKEKQPAAGKDGKAGGGAGQKVQYRVGLSKRSRIAPLLKCLKK
ncbi:hypothetical protein NEMBOFW57_004300 [Staphylotrichum longicolle]|uniref:AT hook domain-containing protein n=1 Tax=Staphylotrichum longicolle TaxID=669026 RepID=A0AAD4F7T5_9PEZI|nr:hypothetical protein NEMBOFW57_004300 [Staphylotrichum longicolle]